MSVSGVIRHHDQPAKVSVIGGGDLGMASVMSILSKVVTFVMSRVSCQCHILTLILKMCFFSFPSSVKWINLFLLTSLAVPPKAAVQTSIFSACPRLKYPEVRHFPHRHTAMYKCIFVESSLISVGFKGSRLALCLGCLSLMTHPYDSKHSLNPNQLLCCR